MRKEYTLRVIKLDKRHKTGRFVVADYDYGEQELTWMQEEIRDLQSRLYPKTKYILDLYETYVTKINMMSGKEYQERFDTPNFCSPSSESYWSM